MKYVVKARIRTYIEYARVDSDCLEDRSWQSWLKILAADSDMELHSVWFYYLLTDLGAYTSLDLIQAIMQVCLLHVKTDLENTQFEVISDATNELFR